MMPLMKHQNLNWYHVRIVDVNSVLIASKCIYVVVDRAMQRNLSITMVQVLMVVVDAWLNVLFNNEEILPMVHINLI
jgi:hypothetical protein